MATEQLSFAETGDAVRALAKATMGFTGSESSALQLAEHMAANLQAMGWSLRSDGKDGG